MITQIFIAGVFLIVLLVLWLFFEKIPGTRKSDKRWLTWSSRKVPYFVSNSPLLSILICYIIICVTIGLEFVIKGIELNSSTILICISIIGFISTIIGLIVTYIQLQRNNNQFFGYDDFYRIAEELLNQNSRRTIRFHFTTPIPGHVAYNKDEEFKKFLLDLKKHEGDIEFIIPDQTTIIKMYRQYVDKTIGSTKYTNPMINKKLTNNEGAKEFEEIDVRTFVNTLRKGNKVKIYEYSVSDNEPEAVENLYLSDGRVSIYAIPLHFLNIQDANKSNEGKNNVVENRPQLIGFVTTDRSLVTSLEENFNIIKSRSNCFVLNEAQKYLNEELVNN